MLSCILTPDSCQLVISRVTGQLAKVAMRSMKSKRLSLATVGHMMTPEHTPYAKEHIEAKSHETNVVKLFSSFFYF